jgi:hypothetical protein
MTIALDPRVLHRVTRDLRHHGLALLDGATITPPDTGASAETTATDLAALEDEVRALGGRLTGLATAVARFGADAFGFDGEVSVIFDQMAAGSLR